jgi:methionine sulfoxide reductase catalytic subunit
MLIRVPPRWLLAEREATAEGVFWDRRRLLRALGATGLGVVAARFAAAEPSSAAPPPAATPPAAAPAAPAPAATPAGYPAPRNERYTLDRPLTPESIVSRHNIFDEMSLDRGEVWRVAAGLRLQPWRVHIGGQVERQQTFEVDELQRRLGLEERLYRFRCVEAWSMAVPWTGFPLRKLVELAAPTAKARYLRMVSFARPEEAPGWYASKRVFPYYEALTLAEATHELAFLATGIYGHTLPPQHGAPLRLVVPWKYGLKGIKSIVAFQFTEERPGTFWNDLSPNRYSFACNVDPTAVVPWPQAEETVLGTGEVRKTLPYNGYAELVAPLYA